MFTRQSPQRLKVLREHALIESAVSSNRIEGVEVDQSRIATIVFGRPLLRDRDEEEVRGYRQALPSEGGHGYSPFLSESEVAFQNFYRGKMGHILSAMPIFLMADQNSGLWSASFYGQQLLRKS